MQAISLSYGNSVGNVPESPEGIRLELPDVAELNSLPASGEITFRFVRENLNLRTIGEAKLSATLCLCEITNVKADKTEGTEKTDDIVDKLFSEASEAGESDSD